jgi:hypothetical protein
MHSGLQPKKLLTLARSVHIISSARVEPRNENTAVDEGGYLLHACSNKQNTCVKQKRKETFKEVKAFRTAGTAEMPLKFYEIELNDTSLFEGQTQGEFRVEKKVTSRHGPLHKTLGAEDSRDLGSLRSEKSSGHRMIRIALTFAATNVKRASSPVAFYFD